MVGTSAIGTGSGERADRRLSEVLVTLARLVLTRDDPGGLARETVLAVATALGADRCEVLRPSPGGKLLLRVASCGEDAGRGGRDAVPCGVSSVAGYALLCGTPVVSGDLEEERRFGAVGAPRRSGPVSAVAAPFPWGDGPGVLAVYAARAGAFDARHALSVGRISSLLGCALWRLEEREELRRRAEEAGRNPGASSGHPHESTPECEGPTPTGRQLEVLALMSDGRSAKRIASELGLSIHTVHSRGGEGRVREVSALDRTEPVQAPDVGLRRDVPADLSGAATDVHLVGLWLHGKSGATVEAYRSDLAKFTDFTDGKPLRTVTLSDVQDFADFISDLLAPASQARILAALKSLFAFGHQVGYLPFDVGRPVKLPAHRATARRSWQDAR